MGIKSGRANPIGQLGKKFKPIAKQEKKENIEVAQSTKEKEKLKVAFEVFFIELDKIELHDKQARSHHSDSHIKKLAESIKKDGLHDPIQVYKRKGKGGEFVYQVLSGEGRYKAHVLLDLPGIPCIVIEDEREALLASVDTNEIRDDLHPIDRGRQFLALEEASFAEKVIQKRYGVAASTYRELKKFARQISLKVTTYLIKNEYYTMRTTRLVSAIAEFYLRNDVKNQQQLDEAIIDSCNLILPFSKDVDPKHIENLIGLNSDQIKDEIEYIKRESRLHKNDREIEKLEKERLALQEQLDSLLSEKTPKKRKKQYDTSTNVMKVQKNPDKGIVLKLINENLSKEDYYEIALQVLSQSLLVGGDTSEMENLVMKKVGKEIRIKNTDSKTQNAYQ